MSAAAKTQSLTPNALRALHAEWHKLAPQVAIAGLTERECRMYWTNEKLGVRSQESGSRKGLNPKSRILNPISSWNDLTDGQAKFLLKQMREQSGDGPQYRAVLIAKLACEFWGPRDWDMALRQDLARRFKTPYPQSLTPAEAHAAIEELTSRIARRDGVEIEVVRGKFSGKKVSGNKVSGVGCQVSGNGAEATQ